VSESAKWDGGCGDLVLTSSLANHTKYATKTHEYLSGTTKNGEKQQGNWDLKMLTIFVCPLVFWKMGITK